MASITAEVFASNQFDYLIIGGGTAGLVVAARLSENPNLTIGVIEAGEYIPDLPEINIPGRFGRTVGNPKVDWTHFTTPQAHVDGRVMAQPRGKVLGGTSALNFMILGRATAAEYDGFETLGNPGWNWSSLLPYFKKAEGLTLPADQSTNADTIKPLLDVHGTEGPLKVSYPEWLSDLDPLFVNTALKSGIPINRTPGDGANAGLTSTLSTIDAKTATRSSSMTAYYEPNKTRHNLIILTGALARKVLFDRPVSDDGLLARGVEFSVEGKLFTALAKREVILSAGSYQTPQLLELSGIGRKKYTADLKIPQLVDLPGVGENLQDHMLVYSVFEVYPKHETAEEMVGPAPVPTLMTFLPAQTMLSPNRIKRTEAQISQAASQAATLSLRKQYELQLTWFKDSTQAQIELIYYPGKAMGPGDPKPGTRYQSILSLLLHPLSRGNVHIASSDPLEKPVIDPAYFSNSADLDLLVQSVKFSRVLALTEPLKSSIKTLADPGPDVTSDDHFVDYIKKHVESSYHPIGTASMLPREEGGVVSSHLVVYGTKNLRIVDASVIPIHISAHIQATVYAMAEKAADIIQAAVI